MTKTKIIITLALLVSAFLLSFFNRKKIMEVVNKLGKTRGLKNNNPGNIDRTRSPQTGEPLPFGAVGYVKYDGEVPGNDKRFRSFSTMAHGYRAIFKLIQTYKVRYGKDTVEGIINRWAPPVENNTSAYVNAVAKRVGVSPGEKLTFEPDQFKKLVAAISKHENGIEPDNQELEAGYKIFAG